MNLLSTRLNQAGMGLGLDLIEKLREERNMLPLYRRKAGRRRAAWDAPFSVL